MTAYLHGVEVIEMEQPPSITGIDSSIIGLIGTIAPPVKTDSPPAAIQSVEANTAKFYTEPYLVTSLDGFFNHYGEGATGTLVDALRDIYSQVATKVVVAPIEKKEELDKGIKLLEKASVKFKVEPKILVAPGLATDAATVKTHAGKLVEAAKKLRAIALVDVIATQNTLSSVTEAVNLLAESDRLYLLYPQVIVKRKESEGVEEDIPRPASSFAAGLIVKSDEKRGYWFSPSNYQFSNIEGLAQEVDFTLGDTNCLANQLNEIKVNTIIWQGGYRLWGNKTYIKTGSAKNFEFLPVRRTADALNQSVLESNQWAIDQAITKNFTDTIVSSVNIYMRELKLKGAIINGKCWADSEKNTTESLAQGRFYVNFDFTAPYPAERIRFQSFMTKNYLNEVLA